MNTFEYIKDNVKVPQAAERYGLSVGRHGMTCCPFHEDHHPSLKLNEDYFYCFGCGAKGDVIDLAGRLLGTSTRDTVSILLRDFNLDPSAEPAKPAPYKRPAIRQLRHDEMECFNVLNAFHRLLQEWKTQYAPMSPEDPLDDHYLLACQQTDSIEYALDVLTVGDLEKRVELVDDLIKTGKLAYLRETLNDIREEGITYDEARAS